MSTPPFSALLQQVSAIARDAAEAILVIYRDDFEVQRKDDHSPVTAADLAAQQVIVAGLARTRPGAPGDIRRSPAMPWPQRREWSRYWLVDPLDGTREFIKRNGEFTVNIALIEDHQAVLGVVLAPVTGELYAAARGQGAWMQQDAHSATGSASVRVPSHSRRRWRAVVPMAVPAPRCCRS